MELVYCSKCGHRIQEADIQAGKAIVEQGHAALCPACRPQASPSARHPRPAGRASISSAGISKRGLQPPARPATSAAFRDRAASEPPRSTSGEDANLPLDDDEDLQEPEARRARPPWLIPLAVGSAAVIVGVLVATLVILAHSSRSAAGKGKTAKPGANADADGNASGKTGSPRAGASEGPPGPGVRRRDPPPVGTYLGGPLVRVIEPREDPRIDGDLADDAWKDAQPLEFRHLDGSADRPACDTTARVIANARALYIGFRAMEPRMDALVASDHKRDGEVWNDDDVEIFLLPAPDSAQPYYQIIFNPKLSKYDGFNKKTDWNPEYRVAVKLGQGFWSVELAIPWNAFSEHRTPPSKLWRMNLTRHHRAGGGPAADWAWSPTFSPNNHVPGKFGYALFEAAGGSLPDDLRQ